LQLSSCQLINFVKTRIASESFGNSDASVCLLMIFEQRSQNPRQCKRTSVQRMAQLIFPFVLESEFQTVCLKGFKIRNRTHFEPFFLSRRKYFKIVSQRCGEAHIAAAKSQNPERQLQISQ